MMAELCSTPAFAGRISRAGVKANSLSPFVHRAKRQRRVDSGIDFADDGLEDFQVFALQLERNTWKTSGQSNLGLVQ